VSGGHEAITNRIAIAGWCRLGFAENPYAVGKIMHLTVV
jgi:hypothetical protein